MKNLVEKRWRERNRLFNNPHFWAIVCIMIAVGIIYRAPVSIIDPRWSWLRELAIFEFKTNLVGSLFFIPFIYAAAVFWWRGILVTWLGSMAIVSPRIVDYSESTIALFTNIVLLLVPLLLVIILDLNRQWRKTIEKSSIEREETRKAYIAEVIKAQEDERNRISREIHDDIIQKLWIVANNTRKLVSEELRMAMPETAESLEKNRDEILGVLQDAKKLSLDLRPGILDDLGLIPAIRWQINQLNNECSLEAKLDIDGAVREFPSEVSTHLFRIIQESLNNIRRHAEATQAIVKLEFHPDTFNLTIQDNGRGFSLAQIENPKDRLGLTGIQERARLIGGLLKIQSEPAMGATISIQLNN
jgi:signal transduction histidine kinase